jgi:hypothetical protein
MPKHLDVVDLIEDHERDFGVILPYEVACRMLILYEMLCELFEEYAGESDECICTSPIFSDRS